MVWPRCAAGSLEPGQRRAVPPQKTISMIYFLGPGGDPKPFPIYLLDPAPEHLLSTNTERVPRPGLETQVKASEQAWRLISSC